MKKIIWGTGLYGSRFAFYLGKDNFDCFIDKDKTKTGKVQFGKKIIAPDDISKNDWNKCYFYIPFNYKKEISDFLISKGLKERENYEVYYERLYFSESDALDVINSYEKRILEFSNIQISNLIIGGNISEKNGYPSILEKLPCDTGIIAEAMWGEKEYVEEHYKHPAIIAPFFVDNYSLVCATSETAINLTEINKKQYLTEAVHQIRSIFDEANDNDYNLTVYLLYQYYLKTLETLKVNNIICFDSVSHAHRILKGICEEKGINIIFTHPGLIAGTNAFDLGGEVGKSLPTLCYDKFEKLNISSAEIEQASDIWSYLYKSKLNRKVQPKQELNIDARIKKGRPIVLFMGQNDVHSYMVPYTSETKTYWSPIFESSTEAAVYLADLCKKNDWNFIYKPHPMYSHPEQVSKLPSNTIFIEFCDINDIIDYCDVAITILSTANYVALIRKKPVVMLGFNQIKGKGCCYEAYERGIIEETIKEALEHGFTEKQQKNFQIHIAQLVKYYLYDDMQPREIRYGKKAPTSFDDFYDLQRLLKENDK